VWLPSLLELPHSISKGNVIVVGLRKIINFKRHINEIGSVSGFDMHRAPPIVLSDYRKLTDGDNTVVPAPGQARFL
jgi:hypothetical protein